MYCMYSISVVPLLTRYNLQLVYGTGSTRYNSFCNNSLGTPFSINLIHAN